MTNNYWIQLGTLAERLTCGEDSVKNEFLYVLKLICTSVVRRQWHRLEYCHSIDDIHDVSSDIFLIIQNKLMRCNNETLCKFFQRQVIANSWQKCDQHKRSLADRHISFAKYIKTAIVRAMIDYQRGHPLYKRSHDHDSTGACLMDLDSSDTAQRAPERSSGWVSLVTLSDHISDHSLLTSLESHVLVREMLSYLDSISLMAVSYCRGAATHGKTRRERSQAIKDAYRTLCDNMDLSSRSEVDPVDAHTTWVEIRELVRRGHLYSRALQLEICGMSQSEIAVQFGVTERIIGKVLSNAKLLLRKRYKNEI